MKLREQAAQRAAATAAKAAAKGNKSATKSSRPQKDGEAERDVDEEAGVDIDTVVEQVEQDADEDTSDDLWGSLSVEELEDRIAESVSQCEYTLLVLRQVRRESMGEHEHGHILMDSDPVKLLLCYNLFREEMMTSNRFAGAKDSPIVFHLSVNFL